MPTSTFVVTVAVVRDVRLLKEKAPPPKVPTLSSIARLDCGRIVMPPGAERSVPETIVAPSPTTTREPAFTVIVVPPHSSFPAPLTTPPPATLAE